MRSLLNLTRTLVVLALALTIALPMMFVLGVLLYLQLFRLIGLI